ncbi:hypothetical protein Tco_1382218 [Tanacetum coccineum]
MKILSILLEITPDLATWAIETPLSSPMGTMWCLCDLTPSSWCKTDALSTDFVQIFYDHVNPATRRTIDQAAGGKLRDKNAKESWALLEDLALYDNESWNDPRDFAKPVKAISLPQDVPSTSDRRLIELENQVQRLMEAHLAPKSSVQVNKITSSCEICSGPHDTQYCMENPEQAFVDYASSRTDEAGDFQLGTNINLHNSIKWLVSTYSSIYQTRLERVLSDFDSRQEKRLSSLGTQLRQQQDDVINKINTLCKVVSKRFDNMPARNTIADSMARVNAISIGHLKKDAP